MCKLLQITDGPDRGATLHFGDPVKEQRALEAGTAWADLSHLEIVAVKGVDRLRWLHDLTTQHLETFSGGWTNGLILDHLGHIEHQFLIFDDGETAWLIVDVDRATALIEYLNKMRFTMRVEVRNASTEKSLIRIPGATDDLGGPYQLVDRGAIPDFSNMPGAIQVGIWALEAERVEKMRPRIGLETDHKSIPNEVGLLNKSVHLNKGCYRGQETVAKVHNLGQPPRKLVS